MMIAPDTHCPECGRRTGRGWKPRRCREHARELAEHQQAVREGRSESLRELRQRMQAIRESEQR